MSEKPDSRRIRVSLVEFPSESATLRGRFYAQPHPAPAIIMAHGFTATLNGMVADRYAEAFFHAGFSVLLYDHRNFGISDGEPRHEINKWVQTRGYHDALTYALGLPGVDGSRLAVWGDSMSGAEALIIASIDERIRAVVAQVPACGSEPASPDPDGVQFNTIRAALLEGGLVNLPHSTLGPMPVVSFDQHTVPSLLTPLTAFRWFMEYGARYGTGWENWASQAVPGDLPPLHPGLCVSYLKAPTLMVVASQDEMPGADSQVAHGVFEATPRPKELLEIDGGHFGLLHYPGPIFDRACQAQIDFLTRYLPKE
jgi:pimeloyl-ACP methyl ester carboxylesterase